MPPDDSIERVVIHGDLIPPTSILSKELESLWPSLTCNMCGHEFTAEARQESTICPEAELQADVGSGLGACRPRLRTLEIVTHLMNDLLAPNKDGELLAFAKTSAEARYVDHHFSSIKSVSLFGNYGEEHMMGIDVRDLSRFESESFTGAFSMLLFDYFPEHERALSELWRVLSPGAIFFTHIAPYRLLDDHTQPFIHKRIEAKSGSFEYLGRETIPDIKVGKYWLHEAIDRCGFDSCTVDINDPISGTTMTWFIGRRRAEITGDGLYVNQSMHNVRPLSQDSSVTIHTQRRVGTAFSLEPGSITIDEQDVHINETTGVHHRHSILNHSALGGYRGYVTCSNGGNDGVYMGKIGFVQHPVYRALARIQIALEDDYDIDHSAVNELSAKEFFLDAISNSESSMVRYSNPQCRMICGQPDFQLALEQIEKEFIAVASTENSKPLAEWLLNTKQISGHSISSFDCERYEKLIDDELCSVILRNNSEDEKLFWHLNSKFFQLPTEKYPWSDNVTEPNGLSSDSIPTTSPIEWEGAEDADYRVIIHDDFAGNIIEKKMVKGPRFDLDWSEFDINGRYRYRIQRKKSITWENITGYIGISPPVCAVSSQTIAEDLDLNVILRWEPFNETKRYRLLIRNHSLGGFVSQPETIHTEFVFYWNMELMESELRYRIQYWSDGKWENGTVYFTMPRPLRESRKALLDTSNSNQTLVHSIDLDLETDLGKRNVNIDLYAPNLPKTARFSEHGFDRVNRESGKMVLAVEGPFLFASDDTGASWYNLFIKGLGQILNTHITANGTILVVGTSLKNDERVLITRIQDSMIVDQITVGPKAWHGTFSIDELDNVIMYAEYPANTGRDGPCIPASVFKSTDDGMSWREVLKVDYPDIRHFHTCTALGFGNWLVTSGDATEQCRFWKSDDDGESWLEITNSKPNVPVRSGYGQLIHRTVVMHPHEGGVIWATDDPVGPIGEFLQPRDGFRTRARLVTSNIEGIVKAEIISDIGMHVRSMIDVEEAFIFITETKYPDIIPTPQVFLVFKNDLAKCHHIADIPNPSGKANKATYSRSSITSRKGTFFTEIQMNTYTDDTFRYHSKMLEWRINFY